MFSKEPEVWISLVHTLSEQLGMAVTSNARPEQAETGSSLEFIGQLAWIQWEILSHKVRQEAIKEETVCKHPHTYTHADTHTNIYTCHINTHTKKEKWDGNIAQLVHA